MKKTLIKTILLTIAIVFILGMFGIGQALVNLITMELVMAVVYIALGYGITYILKS